MSERFFSTIEMWERLAEILRDLSDADTEPELARLCARRLAEEGWGTFVFRWDAFLQVWYLLDACAGGSGKGSVARELSRLKLRPLFPPQGHPLLTAWESGRPLCGEDAGEEWHRLLHTPLPVGGGDGWKPARLLYVPFEADKSSSGVLAFVPIGDRTLLPPDVLPLIGENFAGRLSDILREQERSRPRQHLRHIAELVQTAIGAGASPADIAKEVCGFLERSHHGVRAGLALVDGSRLMVLNNEDRSADGRPLPPWAKQAIQGAGAHLFPLEGGGNTSLHPSTEYVLASRFTFRDEPEHERAGVVWLETRRAGIFHEGTAALVEDASLVVGQIFETWACYQRIDRELMKTVRRLKTVAELGSALTESGLSPGEIQHLALQLLCRHLNVHQGVLVQVDQSLEALTVRDLLGPFRDGFLGRTRPLAGSFAEILIRQKRVVCIPDTSLPGPYASCIDNWWTGHTPKSLLGVPLLRRGEAIGVFIGIDKREGVFDEEDVYLAEAVADWAGLALENASLYEELLTRREQLVGLHESLGRILAAGMSEEDIYQFVMDLTVDVLHVDACAVEMLSADGARLCCAAQKNLSPLAVSPDVPVRGSLTGEAILTGRPAVCEDYQADRRVYLTPNAAASPLHSLAAAPLNTPDGPLGALTVFRKEKGAIPPEDLTLLGAIANHMGVAIQRARLEAERRRRAVFLSSLMENTSELVFVLDSQGRLLYANRSSLAVRSAVESACAEGGADDQHAEEGKRSMADAMVARAAAADWGPFVITLPNEHGKPMDYQMRITPLPSRQEYVVTGIDISQEQQREQIRCEILRNLHHELRTPLASVMGFAQFMLFSETPPSPEVWGQFIETTWEQAGRLEGLLDDLRLYATLPFTAPASNARVDVAAAVRALAAMRAGRVDREHKLEVIIEDEPLPVMFEPAEFQRIIWHLVDNGLKFSPADQPVTVIVRREGMSAEILVRDRGVGMDIARLEEAFLPFHQLDSRLARRFSGLGLGLSLLREAVRRAGGDVALHSAPGQGTTVTVWFPLAPSSPS